MPLTLAFQDYGDHGPPVILLHGLLGSKANMVALGRHLARTRRVYLPDLRNHGDSPHAARMRYGDLAADLAALLDRLALPQAAFVGHSLGGKAAMQLALDQPGRVSRLAVLDIAPSALPEPFWLGQVAAMAGLDLAGLASREAADAALARAVPAHLHRRFLLSNLSRSQDGGYFWRANLEAILSSTEDICAPVAAAANARYPGETLFIRGGRSPCLGAAEIPLLKRLFPSHRLITLAETGHLLHIEAKERLLQELVAFLG